MKAWLGLSGGPPLVRFIIANALVGVLAGAIAAAALIASGALGIRELLGATSDPWIAGLLLGAGFMVTFGSLSAGVALMLSGRTKRPEDQ
jgi:hypothetical protein